MAWKPFVSSVQRNLMQLSAIIIKKLKQNCIYNCVQVVFYACLFRNNDIIDQIVSFYHKSMLLCVREVNVASILLVINYKSRSSTIKKSKLKKADDIA